MARTTDSSLRNLTLYSVFVRNHSSTGDFAGLTADMDRIASLGVGVLWLMPIHPIGEVKRKGRAGSSYAIRDYRAIHPEYGSEEDFQALLEAAHSRGLRVVMDIVYNHTAPDSSLHRDHPMWFWKNAQGRFGNRVGEWSDIIDLDYSVPSLWDYQIETLKYWLRKGVDGFRCDVASLLPLQFWMEAKDACAQINPDTIWIAETVEIDFIHTLRRAGFECLTDFEALRVFDVSYEYDVNTDWLRLLDDEIGLETYCDRLRVQESSLRETDLKLRFVENHDQKRAAEQLGTGRKLRQWTAYSFFAKGMAFIYAGQEYAIAHKPDLFEADAVDWDAKNNVEGRRHEEFIKHLVAIKKHGIVANGYYWLPEAPEGCLVCAYERRRPDGELNGLRVGFFNIRGKANAQMDLTEIWPEMEKDAVLREMISASDRRLSNGMLDIESEPLILDWGSTD